MKSGFLRVILLIVLFVGVVTGSLIIPNSVQTIGAAAFFDCRGFNGQLSIGDGVTSIGRIDDYTGAFEKCSGFSSLSLGNSLWAIYQFTFKGCSGFTGSLTIPNSVRSIYYYAFYGCNNFSGTLTLGTSLTSINSSASIYCYNINTINVLSDTPPTIYNLGLNAVPTNASIIVPCASMPAYRADSYWGNFNNYVDTFEYSLNVTQNNSQMGNAVVTQLPNCSNGASAIVTATPNAGYQFVNWKKNGNVVSTDAIYTFTVTEDISLVANFEVAPSSFTISASANPAVGGTVSGAGEYNHGANVTLTATAFTLIL